MNVTETGNTFSCDCGFSWQRGFSGSHDCSVGLRKQIADLKAQPVTGKCDQDIYENGNSACLVAIPKETAEVICRGISEATGCKVDWHYIGGRVHIKAITQPAVPTTVNFSENFDADMSRKWAWEQVKELVSTNGWDAGDSANFFAFFCWGWDMRRQYNEQRLPAPVVSDTLLEAIEDVIRISDRDHEAWDRAKEAIAASRAVMLTQPARQGYKLNSPETPDGWISCEDRMPEDGDVVLVFQEGGIIYCAEVEGGVLYPDEFPRVPTQGKEITHWMPLPTAPKQGEKQ
jgi:hypothetical protein